MGMTAKCSSGLLAFVTLAAIGTPAGAGAVSRSARSGAVIVVTTTADETGQPGSCSLRDAVTAANTDHAKAGCPAGSGADTIQLQSEAEYDLDIAKALVISSPITIVSDMTGIHGSEVQENGNNLVFKVDKNGSLTLNDVFPIGDEAGTIENRGNLSLFDAGAGGSASSPWAGAITNWGHVQLAQSAIVSGHGQRAGGIYNGKGGTVVAVNTTFYGNYFWNSSGGTQGPSGAGAIFNDGGRFVGRNLTITQNFARRTAGGPKTSAGIYNRSGVVILANSAVGQNGIFFSQGVTGFDDCRGTIQSLGYNLVQTAPHCQLVGTLTGDIVGKNPKLGVLMNNGGATGTAAPRRGSPLIDAGNPAPPGTARALCPLHDERGYPRPVDGNGDGVARCDIGAVEVGT